MLRGMKRPMTNNRHRMVRPGDGLAPRAHPLARIGSPGRRDATGAPERPPDAGPAAFRREPTAATRPVTGHDRRVAPRQSKPGGGT